jgi:hypothetical protein
VVDEQRHSLREIVDRRPAQLLDEHRLRRGVLAPNTPQPRPACVLAQAIGEKERQVIVVCVEMSVVERLRIVRIRAGLEEQPRERIAVRVRRLIRPVFATAERARQRGEKA